MHQTKRRIGIMGGTFDPIHTGHLILGESAYEQFGLDEVLFMPSGNPPHKRDRQGASNEQRVEMVRRAISSNPHFSLSLEEMHEQGYIYTSITLGNLKRKHPEREYYFIMGADSLINFDTWHEPEVIASLCTLVAAVRDHMSAQELDRQIDFLTGKYRAKISRLSTPNIDISSHEIRAWIREGRSCRYYLPDQVRQYIQETGLYTDVSGG